MRVGDFSGLAPIFDANTTRTGSDGRVIRDQFPDNRIPSNRFDPIMQRYLALYPQPNRPGIANNYILNPKYTDDNDQGDIKLDHMASERDSFMFQLQPRGSHVYCAAQRAGCPIQRLFRGQ